MKTDVPLFGSRRLGTLSSGAVHVIFSVNFITTERSGVGSLGMSWRTIRPVARFVFQPRPSTGVQFHNKQWGPDVCAG